MRNIIQIACSESVSENTDRCSSLYVLCDDGSLWFHEWSDAYAHRDDGPFWMLLPGIPDKENKYDTTNV